MPYEMSPEMAEKVALAIQQDRNFRAALPPLEKTGGGRPDWVPWVDMLIGAMRDSGARRAEIVDALLLEAGWIIEDTDAAAPNAAALRSSISEFSNRCVDLVAPPSTAGRLDRH